MESINLKWQYKVGGNMKHILSLNRFYRDYIKDNTALYDYDYHKINANLSQIHKRYLTLLQEGYLDRWNAVEQAVIDIIGKSK